MNKLVFAIVITCIAIGILVLLLLFYKKRPSVNKIIRACEIHNKGEMLFKVNISLPSNVGHGQQQNYLGEL